MKKIKTVALFVLVTVISTAKSFSQNNKKFIGNWEGKLHSGIDLKIVIHIKSIGDTNVSSTLDSPDQNVFGIVADKTTIAEDSLYFEVKNSAASFNGKLENDTTITGTFTQGGGKISLAFTKTNNPSGAHNRPQTPKPPYAYKMEDVEYDNADKTVHFGATFTYPNSYAPFITAILITGSGQQDRDETILGHKPFAVIADYLTRNGFAVLRIDDRGTGKTTGEVMKASSNDFAKDIMTAMDYLKTRKEVDPQKIGLIGHSEGGLIASIIITQRKDVAFIISLAGAGIKGSEILAGQGEVIMIKSGIDEEMAKSYNIFYRKVINYSLTEKDSVECFNKVWLEYTRWQADKKPGQLKLLGFTNEETAKTTLKGLLNELYLPWMQFFNNSDASVNYRKIYCPLLALNGSEDIQVLPKQNLEGIRAGLEKSKSKNYEIKELPGLNHLFQHCKKCSINEYAEIEETFAPEALQVMGDWLKKNIK